MAILITLGIIIAWIICGFISSRILEKILEENDEDFIFALFLVCVVFGPIVLIVDLLMLGCLKLYNFYNYIFHKDN